MFRCSVFGYRRRDVEAELERIHKRIEEMAVTLERSQDENRILRAERETVLNNARAEAEEILATARNQAAEERRSAQRELNDVAGRLSNLVRLREEFLGELRGLVQATTALIDRADLPAPAPVMSLSRSSTAHERPHIRLDAGTFADYTQLARFERSLLSIPHVVDLRVVQFQHGRAAVELQLEDGDRSSVEEAIENLPQQARLSASEDNELVVDIDLHEAVQAAVVH